MTRRMFRYIVPIDNEQHSFPLTAEPVAVAATSWTNMAVEFWAEHDDQAAGTERLFRVFGTGHDIPASARWIGTCSRTQAGFVWHLYEVTS